MSGVLRLGNTGAGTGRSTIEASAGNDQTFTLPDAGGTLLTSNFSDAGGTITFDGATVNITNGDLNVDAGTLFVDESTNRVGIGTTTPENLLHVNSSTANGTIRLSTTSTATGLQITLTGTAGTITNTANDSLQLGSNANTPLKIWPTGVVAIADNAVVEAASLSHKLAVIHPDAESLLLRRSTADYNYLSFLVGGNEGNGSGCSLGFRRSVGGTVTDYTYQRFYSTGIAWGSISNGRQLKLDDCNLPTADLAAKVGINMGNDAMASILEVRNNVDSSAGTVDFDDATGAALCISNRFQGGANVNVSQAVLLFRGRNSSGSTSRSAITGSNELRFYVGENLDLQDDPGFKYNGNNILIGDTVTAVPANTSNAIVMRVNLAGGGRYRLINNTSLNDGQSDLLVINSNATTGSSVRTSLFGNYQSATAGFEGQPAGYLGFAKFDAGTAYVWSDSSNILRISNSQTHVGRTAGTVVGTQTSDIRLKQAVTPCTYGLNELKQLETIFYNFDWGIEGLSPRRIGFSAQQTRGIIPEAVYDTNEELKESNESKLAMEYVQLIPVLVNAIKELEQEVAALRSN